MTDPRLTIAWLVLLHLVAEYVLRPWPNGDARRAAAVAVHGAVVAVCFAPVVVAFGAPGAAVLVVAVIAHVALDRAEAADRRAPVASGPIGEDALPDLSLGPAWTIRPAAVAALVQVLHVAVVVVAWRVFVASAAPTQLVVDLARNVAGGAAEADFHRAVLVAVVGAVVIIVDVAAAARFVGTLLRPWGRPPRGPATTAPVAADALSTTPARGWRIQLGPLTGSIVAEPTRSSPGGAGAPASQAMSAGTDRPSPAAVGRAIGIFERLLITMLVLAQAEAAVALVVGVKTVARYRQLDDRSFAEYYLLGTLASVSIGVAAGLVARLALA